MTFQTVAIVTKPKQSDVAAKARELMEWLRDRHVLALTDPESAAMMGRMDLGVSTDELTARAQLVIVVGGDGTLLAAGRSFAAKGIPILAINYGGLGFLTGVSLAERFDAVERVLSGQYVTQRRMTIDVSVIHEERVRAQYLALNDAVINKGSLARIIELETRVDGRYVTTYRADGLIISTPAGSTAYNLSAGGPIVHPSLQSMVVTPICPHTLTNRPILLPPESAINVVATSKEDVVHLTVDGQVGTELAVSDRVLIRRSAVEVQLVSPQMPDYFKVLREKLKWG